MAEISESSRFIFPLGTWAVRPLQDFQGVTSTPRERKPPRTLRAETGKEQTCSGVRIFPSRLVISFPLDDGGKMTEKGSGRTPEKKRCAKTVFPGASLEGPPSTSTCNERRAWRVYKGPVGLQWPQNVTVNGEERRSRILRPIDHPGHGRGRSEGVKKRGGGEEVSSGHLIRNRYHFSVADPIGASTNHDGEYSFGFLSWLARDLGASIDYAKSRLKSSFRPRGSSTFCLVKSEICTFPQTAIDYQVRKIKRVILYPKTFAPSTWKKCTCWKKLHLQAIIIESLI